MAIESIGGVSQTTTDVLRNAGLGQEDFLKILLTQLSFQDPLKPIDNQEFIAQMAQFSGLELNRQANDKVDALLAFQSVNQAVALIGKIVDVNTGSGLPATGEVTTVTFSNGTPLLNVKPVNPNDPPMNGISLAQISLVRTGTSGEPSSAGPALPPSPTVPNPTVPSPTVPNPTVPNPTPTIPTPPTVPSPVPPSTGLPTLPIPTIPDPFANT